MGWIPFEDPVFPPRKHKDPKQVFDGNVVKPDKDSEKEEKGWAIVQDKDPNPNPQDPVPEEG